MADKIAMLEASREGSSRVFWQGIGGSFMRALVNHRGARTISLVLVAGLLAFEAVLALHAGAVGVPGLFLVPFTDEAAGAKPMPGGETVIAKLDETAVVPPQKPVSAREARTGTVASS